MFLRELLIVVVGAIVVSTLLRLFVGQMFIIPSPSMQNTLLEGDRVVVQKITDFHRGDVVVFTDPGNWLEEPVSDPGPFDTLLEFIGLPSKSTPGHLIKRVIGMPGDHIVCCDNDGRITVNGQPLDEAAYLFTDIDGVQITPSDRLFDVTVPKDRIFVMGDHRDVSADSRYHLCDTSATQARGQVAFVPIADVVGPAFAVAAPFDRATRLRTPASFAEVPAATAPAPDKGVIARSGGNC